VNVAALLVTAAGDLAAAGVASPRFDAEALLAHVLGVAPPHARGARTLTAEQQAAFAILVRRRAAREPLQHLVGSVGFRHVEIAVGPGVFIPRPETEVLAGWAIDQLAAARALGQAEPVAVDLCTGSGAVAATMADEAPYARVHAVELSPDAVRYAARNLSGTGVDLRQGDIADALDDLDGCVDVVVANPPYIPLTAYESVDIETRRHDPALALWSGADGLAMIRTVERVASRLLRSGGVVGCEHADVQGQSAPSIFRGSGRWGDVRDHQDLAERPRFVTARRV